MSFPAAIKQNSGDEAVLQVTSCTTECGLSMN